jgi:hypothetical protein
LTPCQPYGILKIVKEREMVKMIKKINLYFFGEEEIPRSEAVFFYGMYGVMVVAATIAILTQLSL